MILTPEVLRERLDRFYGAAFKDKRYGWEMCRCRKWFRMGDLASHIRHSKGWRDKQRHGRPRP